LDLFHHIFRLIIGGPLFRAPIDSHPQRALDFGTGTGIWAIEFADQFPSATVIGTDLSPIQPDIVPPNCMFYVDDVESEWTFPPEEAFDFIHGRAMGGAIADFPALFRQIYNNLKPGGWVEIQDYESAFCSDDDPNLEKAPNSLEWARLAVLASEKIGRGLAGAPAMKQQMIDAGFVDVHEDIYKVSLKKKKKKKKKGIKRKT
jgi:trans-aconitate methyltransferase